MYNQKLIHSFQLLIYTYSIFMYIYTIFEYGYQKTKSLKGSYG